MPAGTVYFTDDSSSFQDFSAFQKRHFQLQQQHFQLSSFRNEPHIQEQLFSTGLLDPSLLENFQLPFPFARNSGSWI